MKKMLILVTAVLAIALLCFNPVYAQQTTSPDKEKKPTGMKKGKMEGAKEKKGKSVTVQGCLDKGTEANCFTLAAKGGKMYSFQNPEAEKHIGHTVKITGMTASGAQNTTCMQGMFLTDVKLQHISPTCTDKGKPAKAKPKPKTP